MLKKHFISFSLSSHPSFLILSLLLIIFAAIPLTVFFSQQQQQTLQHAASSSPGLLVSSTTLLTKNNTRFIVKGVNMEYYRDNGCSYVTDTTTSQAPQIIAKLKSVGINAVRLNYTANWVSQGTNINTYLNFMQQLASNGIYVMPSDHSFTGLALTNYQTVSFPMFQAIIQGARSRGIENYVIMNPYNEPFGQDSTQSTWTNWIAADEATLNYLRNTLGFKGVVVLDTKDWATGLDKTSLQTVMQYDASLLGTQSNLVFSNHWYPNISYTQTVQPSFALASTIPLVIGEVGHINPGASGIDDNYVTTLLNDLVSTAIPNGHNGAFPWIWAWCDENSMTAAWNDEVTLSTYGQLIINDFYSKVSEPGSVSTPTPLQTPPTIFPTSAYVTPTLHCLGSCPTLAQSPIPSVPVMPSNTALPTTLLTEIRARKPP